MKNKLNTQLSIDTVSQITMLLQIALAIFLVTFGIISLYERELFIICEILIGLSMFVIAFNNQKIYKRKYMTAIYLGLGIVIIASSLFA